MAINFKEFSKSDWNAFAGAEKADGQEPLIANIQVVKESCQGIKGNDWPFDAICVVDGNGIHVEVTDPEYSDSNKSFYLEIRPFVTAVFYAKKQLLGRMSVRYLKTSGLKAR